MGRGAIPGLFFWSRRVAVLPVSVKGVVVDNDRVLLLLNERGQWDLPGGRP